MLRGVAAFWEHAVSALDFQAAAKNSVSLPHPRRSRRFFSSILLFFIGPITCRREFFCGEGKENEP